MKTIQTAFTLLTPVFLMFSEHRKVADMHGAECDIGNIFIVFQIMQLIEIKTKCEEQGNYLPLMLGSMGDNFIAKCLLKSNVAKVIFLTF